MRLNGGKKEVDELFETGELQLQSWQANMGNLAEFLGKAANATKTTQQKGKLV